MADSQLQLYQWMVNDMGKWLMVAMLLGLLALALWDGYEQWILVAVSVQI